MASLTAMQARIGEINTEKGFRSIESTTGDRLALITSEVSEALEEIRDGRKPDEIYFGENVKVPTQALRVVLDVLEAEDYVARADNELSTALATLLKAVKKVEGKPEGYAVELADAAIRILDEFDRIGLDAEKVIQMKMDFNEGRPYLHGGKVL